MRLQVRYSVICLELPELLRWEFQQAMEPLTCFFSGLAGWGAGRGVPFSKIRLLVPSTIRRDNRNWRQEVTPPWGAFPLLGHRLPGWWSEAGPAWRGGELIEQGWSWVTVSLLPQRRFLWTEQRIACRGGGLIRAGSAIIISILGCHVLDICFPAVNSLPLMSPKMVYAAGTE